MPQLLNENEVSYYLGEKHIYPKGSGGSAEIPIINHGTSDAVFEITPNEFHLWGEMSSLDITLETPENPDIVNLYMFQFTSGATPTVFTTPASLNWDFDKGVLTPAANETYEVNIRNNMATWIRIL